MVGAVVPKHLTAIVVALALAAGLVLIAQPTEVRAAESRASGQYPGATWYGAHPNNYQDANRGPAQINKIVVHVTQGSYWGQLRWARNPDSRASSHYTVRSSDGKIGQSVKDQDIAYHAGCASADAGSIGIEHEGYASEPRWFTDAMYRSSAKLVAYAVKRYGIPIDRSHFLSHDQIACSNHTDPGPHWDWDKYLSLVRSYAYAGAAPYTQTVDNASSRFSASSRWTASSYHQDASYGDGHRVLKAPLSFADNAKFRIKTPAQDTYAVYARWPADPGYNDQTAILVQGVNGWNREVRTQRANGGAWVKLGDYTFPAGDSARIQVSSQSPDNGMIVADAVKIVRR